MKPESRFRKVVAAAVLCFAALGAEAMHIGYLYPAGGRAGTTVEVLVGGRALWGASGVHISGGGIKKVSIERVPHLGHIPGAQKRWMTKYLKQIRAGKTEAPPRPEDTKEWRKHRYYDNLGKLSPLQLELVERNVFIPADPLQKSPSIADMVIVKLEIAPDAAPGRREFRLVGRGQISDPLPFYVDTAPEVNEPRYTPPGVRHPRGEFKVPAVLNGQILPRESDFFDFSAREGEVITFSALGRALVPFLGDSVPGHFQLVLEVWNADGLLVASADDHYFDPDPVLVFRARKAGKYTLRVRDALYRGREDFVYRIRVRRGRPGLQIPVPPGECGKWTEDGGEDKELEIPAFIRFKLARPGAKIRRSFRAEAGTKLELEVLARCLGSPLDGRMTLYAPDGKVLARVDDVKRPRIGTILHQADPRLEAALPESGVYTVEVADASGTGGAESFGYLRILPPKPDFQLYASPSGVSAAINAPAAVRVRAVRKNGFDGRIVLTTSPDSELKLVGANSLEVGMDEGVFTFVARSWRKPDTVARPVRLIGIADGGNAGDLVREAHAVDEAMQAFAYTHLVPAQELLAMQCWGAGCASHFSYVDPFRVLRASRGGSAVLDLWRKQAEGIEVEYSLLDPPAGITLAGVSGERGMVRLTIRASESAAPGKYNLIPRISCKYVNEKGKRIVERFLLPAVRMEVTECPAK